MSYFSWILLDFQKVWANVRFLDQNRQLWWTWTGFISEGLAGYTGGNASDWAERFTAGDQVLSTAGNHSGAWSRDLHLHLLDISTGEVKLPQESCIGCADCLQINISLWADILTQEELSKGKQGQGSHWLTGMCLFVAHMTLHYGALCLSPFFSQLRRFSWGGGILVWCTYFLLHLILPFWYS